MKKIWDLFLCWFWAHDAEHYKNEGLFGAKKYYRCRRCKVSWVEDPERWDHPT